MITIKHYRSTRYWAVYINGTLLAVVLYKKGAKAIAETIAAARTVYLDDFACDMPDTIHGELTMKAEAPTRLFTDGKDHLFLSVPSAR